LIEDVTERKLAEEKLEASQDLFRRIVETAAEGIWIIDGETRTTFTNRRMAEMLGYEPSDLIGRSCFEFIHPDDIDRGRDGFEKRKQGDTAPREYRAYRSDGSIIWISFTASPMKDEQGNLTGVLGMCTDISQRKRTEEALIQNEMRYRLVARATNDAIWDWDLENDHIVWNEAVETLFGHSMESVSHDSAWWLDRVHAEDRERVSRRLHQVIEGSGENWSEEYRFKRADGSYAAVYDRGYLLRNREGKPIRMIGSMLDVTERKRAEEALQKSNEALRRMNENLRQFAYAASHDLREPLRMVSIYSQLLSKRYKGKLDEDADTFLGFTEQGAKRMQLLLDDLLAFSQAGDTRDKPIEPVDCNSAVHMALQNLKRAIEENSAVVTADPLPIVQAHLSHLIQVFQNLIGNALKYRGEEVPRVHISAGSREHDWIFYVRDNGIGIDAKYHKLIFGLFKRLHHPEAHPGTGIGLSICARVVERYGGHIWVESEHGKGSTFCFTIPKKVE
jgi:two-component system CheB/CheR fusion protein